MLYAEKANRRVRIPDEKKDEYIGMGYTVKNMDGTVIKEPENPKKAAEALSKENADLKAKLEEAEAGVNARLDLLNSVRDENEALKKENADLKAKIAELEAGQKPAEDAATGGKNTKGK